MRFTPLCADLISLVKATAEAGAHRSMKRLPWLLAVVCCSASMSSAEPGSGLLERDAKCKKAIELLVGPSGSPAAATSTAGPNAGGVLVVHDTGVAYSTDTVMPPPTDPPASFDQIDNTCDLGVPADYVGRIWKVYAVFPSTSSPRLSALAWSVNLPSNGDGYISIQTAGLPNPADFEVTYDGWPNTSGGQIGMTFSASGTRTDLVTECYWFAGYGYGGPGGYPQMFCTQSTQSCGPGIFVDDAPIKNSDLIADFGCLGFGQPGYTPSPELGACCEFVGTCTLVREGACTSPTAIWHGDWVACDPNPCPELFRPPVFLDSFGSPGSGPGQFNYAAGIATSDDGFVYLSDSENCRVQKFTATGEFVSSFGSPGTGPGQFRAPSGIDVDAAGNVYVADRVRVDVQKFSSDSTYLGTFGGGVMTDPCGLWVSDEGVLYVADYDAYVIHRFTVAGERLPTWGPDLGGVTLSRPHSIEGDGYGLLYVSEPYSVGQVHVLTTDGAYVRSFGSPWIGRPMGAALAQSSMYLAEFDLNRVSEVTPGTGAQILTIGQAGGTSLSIPNDCATSGDSLLFVLDSANHRVLRFRLVLGAAASAPEGAIAGLALYPPAPNPTVGDCRIAYALPGASRVRLSVFDVQGREIAVLVNGAQSAGRHEQRWAGGAGATRLASGVYFVCLRVDGRSELRQRIVIVR